MVLDSRLIITELVASNNQGLADVDGERPDWIELHNVGDATADLSGWSLTDDVSKPAKWRFPDLTLDPGQYLVVFASGKDRTDTASPLHTNFRLDRDGEYLGLNRPDGSAVSSYSFPLQFTDVSFGLAPGQVPSSAHILGGRYFSNPTPGGENSSESAVGKVGDLQVNIGRGFYDQPQDIVFTTETAGATFVYTTNGSLPSAENGIQISPVDKIALSRAELTIASTTTLRVAAIKDDYISSDAETHTYLFVDDVIQQSPNGEAPEGWPSAPVNGQRFDYGMDPDIVNDPVYGALIKEALLDIPSFSIVTELAHLFDAESGIFVNGEEAREDNRAFERPTSVELIQPDGSQGFHANAGIRMRGGFSRLDNNPKHAFRLFFRGEYGDTKLNFPLFGDDGVDSFDNIDLRTAQAPSWSWCTAGAPATGGGCRFSTMVRDVFSRDSQRDMGHPGTRSSYYHLYLNGHYWGLFQTQERPEASYAESYFGGDKEDYDVIKVESFPHRIVATDGDTEAWRLLWEEANSGFSDDAAYFRVQGLNVDGSRNPDYPVLLDLDNLADYMALILYSGNLDAPISNFGGATNNWFGIRDRVGEEGFQFFVHDAEWTLLELDENRLGPWRVGDQFSQSNPQWIHQQLMESVHYRVHFGDRVQKHMFNGGALTPEASLARIQKRIDEIDLAIIAESARWGDANRAEPLTKEHWLAEVRHITDDYIPSRREVFVEQLRNAESLDSSLAPLYPQIDAPVFSQHGCTVRDGFELVIAGPGDIYYTTDGSDPREQPATIQFQTLVASGSDVNFLVPSDDALEMNWTTPTFVDDDWTSGKTGIGFQRGQDSFGPFIAADVETEMSEVNTSIYTRIEFAVEEPTQFEVLHLRLRFDDGFVAYLNGSEIAQENAPQELQWDSRATTTQPNSVAVEYQLFNVSRFSHLLLPGKNVLAIHGLNRTLSGSDFLLSPELQAGTATESGSSLTSTKYSEPIPITEDSTVKSRSLWRGTWSALIEASFVHSSNQNGDLNGDSYVDQSDIDALHRAINSDAMDLFYDLDDNMKVDASDVAFLVENILGTVVGDANLDGNVDALDLNVLGVNWQRADGTGWSTGDFNGDGVVEEVDLNQIDRHWGRVGMAWRAPLPTMAKNDATDTAIYEVAETHSLRRSEPIVGRRTGTQLRTFRQTVSW